VLSLESPCRKQKFQNLCRKKNVQRVERDQKPKGCNKNAKNILLYLSSVKPGYAGKFVCAFPASDKIKQHSGAAPW